MAELKSNGLDYRQNKTSAIEVWGGLSVEEKEVWNNQTNTTQKMKQLTGSGLFIKEKMAELKPNGEDYRQNKSNALDAWNQLSVEEKEIWNNKVSSIEHK